jgi:hypothetical protein
MAGARGGQYARPKHLLDNRGGTAEHGMHGSAQCALNPVLVELALGLSFARHRCDGSVVRARQFTCQNF